MDHRHRDRLFGLYLAYWAWMNRVDCVVLEGGDLLRYFGHSQKIDTKRLRSLQEELEPFFPMQRMVRWKDSPHDLILSRRQLPPRLETWHAWRLTENGVPAKVVGIPSDDELREVLTKVLLSAKLPFSNKNVVKT